MMRQTVIAAFTFAAMAAVSVGAHAQSSVSIGSTGSFTEDGWTIMLSSCSYTASGVASSCSALPSTDVLKAVSTSQGTAFELVNTAGGPVMSITTTSAASFSDLTLHINLVPTSNSSLTLDTISAAVVGTTTSNGTLADITAGLTVSSAGGTTYPQVFFSAAGSTSPFTFTPTNGVTLTEDLKLSAPAGTTLTLTNTTTNAPEPASMIVLGPAVLALIKARRSRKRRHSASV
jgi:hypothetical protein